MSSDEALYEQLRQGDLTAFDRLYERYERPLFGFILRYVTVRQEAEDLFHEAFLQLLRGRTVSFTAGSFRAWIYQIARNQCLNHLRKRTRGAAALDRAGLPEAPLETIEMHLDRGAAHAALARAIARLPKALSEVFRLRASGLSYEEIATALSIPLGTVKSRLHEAVHALKREMHPWTVG